MTLVLMNLVNSLVKIGILVLVLVNPLLVSSKKVNKPSLVNPLLVSSTNKKIFLVKPLVSSMNKKTFLVKPLVSPMMGVNLLVKLK